jgi:hypothetical protein
MERSAKKVRGAGSATGAGFRETAGYSTSFSLRSALIDNSLQDRSSKSHRQKPQIAMDTPFSLRPA